jgi:Putative Ig domain
VKKAVGLISVAVFLLTNCGGGSSASSLVGAVSPQPSVAISPSTQQSIDQGQTVSFTASVTNDSNGKGVSWSVSGSGCSGSNCGTLANTSKTAATYNAPAVVSSPLTVTVKASSAAKTSVSASSTVTVNPSPVVTTTLLPGGVVGNSYSATLKASGGTGSLSWNLASGSSLSAGLSLDATTGVISGTPTASGTTNFTVQVTDSAPTPVSATQSLSITIASRLIITTALLPNGSLNLAYTTTLQASGGTKPYTWSNPVGILPAGLSLDASTGVISGTPTTAEKSSFTVQVADASTQSVTRQLSITIEPALTITTTSLSDGTLNVAYSATVEAGYAILPVTWSISSGALPTGLTMDAGTGSISGTPLVAGTSNFTVMLTDSSTPQQTATQPLSITINDSGMKNTELSGRYAFLLSGYDTHGNRVAAAGSFVADGAGKITGGVEDLNDRSAAPQAGLTINSGTYSVGADNRGTITFTNSAGSTFTMAVAVGNLVGGTAEKGSAVEFDSSGFLMSGVIEWQNSASFLKQDITGSYAFGFTGSDMAGNRLAIAGQFTADGSGGITGGVFDADDSGTPTTAGAIGNTGTYSVDTTTGRCAVTLDTVSSAPAVYVFYIVSAGRMLALSMDTASTSGLVTGAIDAQTGGPYSNSSLSGAVVMGVDSSGLDGSHVMLGVVTLDGSGNAGFSTDENNAGALTTVTGSGTYTTPDALTGRFTLASPQGTTSLAGYLVSANRAFVVGADSGVTAGTFQAQSAGPFSNSSLNFIGFFGDQEFAGAPAPPPYGVLPATLSSGVASFDGAGNLSIVSDKNVQGTLLSGQTSSTAYSVSSSGRMALGSGSSIFYIVSPTKLATMSASPGDPNPTLGSCQQ